MFQPASTHPEPPPELPPELPDSTLVARRIAGALRYGRTHDPLGHQIHTALAALFLFTLPLATAPKDIAFGLLLVWTIIRLPHTRGSYREMLRAPAMIGLLCWLLMHVVSLLWSANVNQGFKEIGAQRMLLLPLMLWPVLDRLPWLIGAALLGVLAQNVAQLCEALGWLPTRLSSSGEGRFGGLIHPIQTAAWCVAAMCWHLAAILNARSRMRWLSVAGLVIATAGLIATASRGPWLSAAIAIPLMLVAMMVRSPGKRNTALLLVLGGALAAGAAWPLFQSTIARRLDDAVTEARNAQERGAYLTSVGLRIGMAKWAWTIFQEHPILGTGAGSYRAAQAKIPDFQAAKQRVSSDRDRRFIERDHPHSIVLYTLACLGIVGGVVLVGMSFLLLRQTWMDPLNHLYADGSLFVLISWFIGAQFDCYNLSGQYLGMFAFIAAITLPHRAAIRSGLRAVDPGEEEHKDAVPPERIVEPTGTSLPA